VSVQYRLFSLSNSLCYLLTYTYINYIQQGWNCYEWRIDFLSDFQEPVDLFRNRLLASM